MTDRTFTWIRRTRIAGLWADHGDVPLGEETEDYQLDILDDAGLVTRTITAAASAGGSVIDVAAHTALYTTADQSSDWGGAAVDVPITTPSLDPAIITGVVSTPFAWITSPASAWRGYDSSSSPYGLAPNTGAGYPHGTSFATAELYQDVVLDEVARYEELDKGASDATLTVNQATTRATGPATDQGQLELQFMTRAGALLTTETGALLAVSPANTWLERSLVATVPFQTRIIRMILRGVRVDPDSVLNVAFDGPLSLTLAAAVRLFHVRLYQLGTGGRRGHPATGYL